jgi:hypothetical protein
MDDDFKKAVRQIIREELSGLLGSSQYQFQKDAKFYDGRNIQLGLQSGTMIGTTASQKLGFFGKTPVAQQSTPSTVGGVIALLQSLGLSQ